MKNFIKNKIAIVLFAILPFASFAQLGPVSESLISGTYAKGSSIVVPFTVGNLCFKPDNVFELYLSPTGFTTPGDEILIGRYKATYANFINGLIPSAVSFSPVAGQVYKLKVKATSPSAPPTPAEWICPTTFSIAANSGPSALVSVPSQNVILTDTIFGLCQSSSSSTINFTISKSILNTTANSLICYIKDEISLATTSGIDITTDGYGRGYASGGKYSFIVKSTGSNGSISTRGYVIANLKTATGITFNLLQGCAPETLEIVRALIEPQ